MVTIYSIGGYVTDNRNNHQFNRIRQYNYYAQSSNSQLYPGSSTFYIENPQQITSFQNFYSANLIGSLKLNPVRRILNKYIKLSQYLQHSYPDYNNQSVMVTDIDQKCYFVLQQYINTYQKLIQLINHIKKQYIIMVPDKQYNNRNWLLFKGGQRHKFMMQKFVIQTLQNKKYYYIWKTAQDIDGNLQQDSAQFLYQHPQTGLSQINCAHFQLGLYDKSISRKIILQPGILPKQYLPIIIDQSQSGSEQW